jgi:5-methylcytosine-specific restriction protein B
MYQELQTQAFNWLKNKYNQDNNFTFSVRQKANKEQNSIIL